MGNKEIKLKCLVVEDERPAQWVLMHFIELTDFLELITCVSDAHEAKQIIESQKVDLLFLDINLPGISGIELLNTLEFQPPVIFTTAYASYAAVSFDYNVIDYLLKPISQEHFDRAVKRAIDKKRAENAKTTPENENFPSFIDIPIGIDAVQVDIKAITYLQSWGNYVKVFTNEKMILASISTQGLLDLLPSSRFIRVHKSFTINRDYVTSRNNKEIVVASNVIPVGISYRQSINNIFQKE
jgi:DNA-binding LytR/AlgR family response regulator